MILVGQMDSRLQGVFFCRGVKIPYADRYILM